ncbi:MAG: hypothetical protein K2G37_05210 [Clostridia bacterium]|nr:hypothetical protein [Clostridia bacterium]MDE7328959.1 hypothetical protein [Clostridia bacterium]
MIKYRELLENTKAYKVLDGDIREGRLNHCYMITSEDELALDGICTLFAQRILCKDGGCGKCVSCMKVEDNNHEGVYEPKNLKADGIREFIEKVYITGDNDVKVMIIRRLDQVDVKVQNFLLKSLEEPVDGVVFALGVQRQTAVLDTIKSRSKKLSLAPFSKESLKDYFSKEFRGYSKAVTTEAVDCSLGSLTRCDELLNDEDFAGDMTDVIFMLKGLTSSKVNLKMQRRLDIKGGKLVKYLDIMQLICGVLLKKKTGVAVDGFEKVNALMDTFNVPTLVNFNELIVNAKQKVESYCKEENILDNLFIKLLEVKYLCR